MNRILANIKGALIVVYLVLLFYIVLKNNSLSTALNIPIWFFPTITLLSIFQIGYGYAKSLTETEKIEYEFTSIVNHTFRTPLTKIMWFIKELEKDLPQNEKLLYLQGVENSTNRVLEIVDLIAGIQSINDKTGYFFQATSIRDIAEKSIEKYREEINKKNINFKISTFKDIPLLTIDLKKKYHLL